MPIRRSTPLRRRQPQARPPAFPQSLEKADWQGVVQLTRGPLKHHAVKRKEGFDDPNYRAWVRSWPCFVCLKRHCEVHALPFEMVCETPAARGAFCSHSIIDCGVTEFAHVGEKGMSQRCPDREAMPLGAKHHRTGKDAHHAGTAVFWAKHGLDKSEVIALLNKLYVEETGRDL